MVSSSASHGAAQAVAIAPSLERARAFGRRRLRLETVTFGLAVGNAVFAALCALLLLLPWFGVGSPWSLPAKLGGAAAVAAGCGLGAALIRAWSLGDARRLNHRLDIAFGLDDAALTEWEMHRDPELQHPAWRGLQRTQLEQRIGSLGPLESHWPLRWPPGLKRSAACAVLLLACVLMMDWRMAHVAQRAAEAQREADAAARSPLIEEHRERLAHLLTDWQTQARSEAPEREQAPLAEDMRALLDAVQAGDISDRDMLREMSSLQQHLAAGRTELAQQSLAPHAPQLADALDKLRGAGALAAALRRSDFQEAANRAAEMAQQLRDGRQSPPPPSAGQAAARQLNAVKQQMQSQQQAQARQAVEQLSQGAAESRADKLQAGMEQMQQALNQEAARQSQMTMQSQQQRELGELRDAMADRGDASERAPSLARPSNNRPPGQGPNAGTEPGRRDMPPSETLAASRRQENLAGRRGDQGDAQLETLRSATPSGPETPRASQDPGATPSERESSQAVVDESLPWMHRQSIRRYFEAIRPVDDR